VLDGTDIRYVQRLLGTPRLPWDLQPALQTGSRLPAYCTALGKTLLAHLPKAERKRCLSGIALRRRGPNTIVNKRVLARELEKVLDSGLAVSNEELAVKTSRSRSPSETVGGTSSPASASRPTARTCALGS
jgi:IclR family pca regulon transcriptional regulator